MAYTDGFSCRKGVLDQFIDLLLDTVFIKGMIEKNGSLRRPQPQNLCCLKTEGLRGGPAVQEEETSPLQFGQEDPQLLRVFHESRPHVVAHPADVWNGFNIFR